MQQNRTNEILCVAKSQFALHTPYIRPEILGNGSAAWNRYCNILTIAAKKNAVNNAENLHRDYNEITKTQFNCDKLHSFVPRKCKQEKNTNSTRALRQPFDSHAKTADTQADKRFFSFYFYFWLQSDTFRGQTRCTMILMRILILLLIPTPFPIPFAMLIYATTATYNPHLAFRRVLSQWQMKLAKCMHATISSMRRIQQE